MHQLSKYRSPVFSSVGGKKINKKKKGVRDAKREIENRWRDTPTGQCRPFKPDTLERLFSAN